MRWIAFRSESNPKASPSVGLLQGESVHQLAGVSCLTTLLGDDGTRLREAAKRAKVSPDRILPLDGVTPLPPIPHPGTIRDFSSFEAHYQAGLKAIGRRFDPSWYEAPAFYFSNPHCLVGGGVEVVFPDATREMDFELEVAAIIGREGRDLDLADAESCISGYTIFNDWSARDLLRDDLRRSLLGPSKGKDFANGLGPWFVSADELAPYRRGKGYDLLMTASVNGREVSRGNWADIHWSFAEMLVHASRNARLVPGDIIASGTVGTGCMMELSATHGAEGFPYLGDGDEVTLSIEGLGSLTNRVRRAPKTESILVPRR